MKKNFGDFVLWVVICLFGLELAGCATVQKKFTRKKKEPARQTVILPLDQGPYQKRYSNDYYYKTHYTMWRTWHDELLNELGGNSKRVARAAEEDLSNLQSMQTYLVGDKKDQLGLVLGSLNAVLAKIDQGRMASGEEATIKSELERIGRTVASNFYYDKIKDSLLPDTVDLGAQDAVKAPSSP